MFASSKPLSISPAPPTMVHPRDESEEPLEKNSYEALTSALQQVGNLARSLVVPNIADNTSADLEPQTSLETSTKATPQEQTDDPLAVDFQNTLDERLVAPMAITTTQSDHGDQDEAEIEEYEQQEPLIECGGSKKRRCGRLLPPQYFVSQKGKVSASCIECRVKRYLRETSWAGTGNESPALFDARLRGRARKTIREWTEAVAGKGDTVPPERVAIIMHAAMEVADEKMSHLPATADDTDDDEMEDVTRLEDPHPEYLQVDESHADGEQEEQEEHDAEGGDDGVSVDLSPEQPGGTMQEPMLPPSPYQTSAMKIKQSSSSIHAMDQGNRHSNIMVVDRNYDPSAPQLSKKRKSLPASSYADSPGVLYGAANAKKRRTTDSADLYADRHKKSRIPGSTLTTNSANSRFLANLEGAGTVGIEETIDTIQTLLSTLEHARDTVMPEKLELVVAKLNLTRRFDTQLVLDVLQHEIKGAELYSAL